MLVNIGEQHQTVVMNMDNKINITKIPVLWITIASAKDRHEKVKSIFSKFGFENTYQIDGEILNKNGLSFVEIQKRKSALVADAHIKALQMFEPPFLILEDDIGVLDSYLKKEINIPKDADCVYLGSSVWGMESGQSVQWGTKKIPFDETYCLVQDMLGIHSIIYVSKAYVQATVNNLLHCNSIGKYCDECIAEDMKNHKVYCVNHPMFFQDDGRNNLVTSMPMAEYPR